MSPQMNGEPRDAQQDAERPLPQLLNTDRVTKSVVPEEGELAPLFTESVAADLRRRWDLVQRSFVDDPNQAVHAADELVAEVTKALTDIFASQRLDHAEVPTTESLRIAFRQYRSFFEHLLSI